MKKEKTYKKIRILAIILLIVGISIIMLNTKEILALTTATGEVTISNSVPTTDLVSLNGGADITLTAGTTTSVICKATVTDNEGCSDISSVEAVIYNAGFTVACSPNATRCYTMAAGAEQITCAIDAGSNDCLGGSDLSADYNCTANIRFNADPTAWVCEIRGLDGTGTGNYASSSNQNVNQLTAINILEATMQYKGGANIALGECSTSDGNCATVMTDFFTVENYGNIDIDFNLRSGNGLGQGMDCDIGTSIRTLNMAYDLTSINYNTATTFTSSYVQQDSSTLGQAADEATSQQKVYTAIKLDASEHSGFCDGILQVEATTPFIF